MTKRASHKMGLTLTALEWAAVKGAPKGGRADALRRYWKVHQNPVTCTKVHCEDPTVHQHKCTPCTLVHCMDPKVHQHQDTPNLENGQAVLQVRPHLNPTPRVHPVHPVHLLVHLRDGRAVLVGRHG